MPTCSANQHRSVRNCFHETPAEIPYASVQNPLNSPYRRLNAVETGSVYLRVKARALQNKRCRGYAFARELQQVTRSAAEEAESGACSSSFSQMAYREYSSRWCSVGASSRVNCRNIAITLNPSIKAPTAAEWLLDSLLRGAADNSV